MPRVGARRQMLRELHECIEIAALHQVMRESSSDSESDTDSYEGGDLDGTEDLMEEEFSELKLETSDSESEEEEVLYLLLATFNVVMDSRYTVVRSRVPRSVDFRYNYFLDLPANDFCSITRLSKPLFEYVVGLISSDPIFHNDSWCNQAPVQWQLACCLDRLGNDGQGVSIARSKMVWGLGHGTVLQYYNRVLHAIGNLRFRFITWSDARERQQISLDMESKGFKGVVGFVDGTTFPLHVKPSLFGNSYLDRKKRYSVNAQIVCDNRQQIRHLITGMPGSCHDSRVFKRSPLVQASEYFSSHGQYLLGDSAYTTSPYLVPAYRSNSVDVPADPMDPTLIERFNTYLAQARVINEHTIGVLKSRWSSLRGLRTVLQKEGDINKVVRHVIACVVLHNIAMQRDPWDEDLPLMDENPPDEGHRVQYRNRRWTDGQRKRYEVRVACLEYFDRQDRLSE